MSAQKIKNKKAQLRQKLGGDVGSGRFLFHKSSSSGITSLPDIKSTKNPKFQLQNDLISGLPKNDAWKNPQQNLDIISNCPPGQMDDFDGIDRIIEVRYVQTSLSASLLVAAMGAGHNDVELYSQYLERLKQFVSVELVN